MTGVFLIGEAFGRRSGLGGLVVGEDDNECRGGDGGDGGVHGEGQMTRSFIVAFSRPKIEKGKDRDRK